jgi:hypothetical protein
MTACTIGLALVILAASVAGAQTAVAADETGAVQLPVKGRIDAPDGKTWLTFRVYDAARGGSLVYTESRSVPVTRGIYFAMVGGRNSALTASRSVWVEVARGTGQIVGDRQAFTVGTAFEAPGSDATTVPASSVCFTCGGKWPAFSGFVYSEFDAASGAGERGSSCSGSIVTSSDFQPFICSHRFAP